MTWEETRARLLHDTRSTIVDRKRHMADIRAALERVEEQGDAWLKLWNEHQASKAECAVLRQRLEELEDEIEMDGGSWRVRAEAAEAKLARCVEAGEALYFALRHASSEDAPVEILRAWRAAAKGE